MKQSIAKRFLTTLLHLLATVHLVRGSSATVFSRSSDDGDDDDNSDEARVATVASRDMPLSLFKRLFFNAVSDANTTTEEQELLWNESTSWGWIRAFDLDENMSTPHPFVICDDGNMTALERKTRVISDALGVMEPPSTNLSQYFVTILNAPNISCYIGLANATIAQTMASQYVQPATLRMKINPGTLSFTDLKDNELLQYAVWLCPGSPQRNRTQWALDLLQSAVPLISQMIDLSEVEAYKERLSILQSYLLINPNFCDPLILENVDLDVVGRYWIATFNSRRGERAEEEGFAGPSETCFILLTFSLAYEPEVCYIERREAFNTFNAIEQWIGQSGVPDYRPFFENNITGSGQLVAVSDTGLDLQNCYFRDANEIVFGMSFDLSRRKVVQYVDFVNSGEAVDGHGTHVAGTIAGHKSIDGITDSVGFADGIAKDAKLCFFDIGWDDEEGQISIPGGAKTLLDAGKAAGARIHSASWGSPSNYYTNQDRDIDVYLHQDQSFLFVVAAGNDGPNSETVGSPAVAKNVLTVGASTSADTSLASGREPVVEIADFSSVGPSKDKRIKPDIVAPGAHVVSAGSRTGPSCDPPDESGIPGPGQSNLEYGLLSLQGTSMATPVVAGHCALLRQYFLEGWHGDGTKGSAEGMDPSATLLKATVINGAQPLVGYGLNEVDAQQGFGRLSLIDTVPLEGSNELTGVYINSDVVNRDETVTYNYVIAEQQNKTCDNFEFSVTLVWADLGGFLGCSNCLLHNLDLFVVQTTGGTNATTGPGVVMEHFPNGKTGKDDVNNVERVRVKARPGDSFVVTVTASYLESESQNFALAVVYGCMDHRLDQVGFTQRTTSAATAPLRRRSRSSCVLWSLTWWGCLSVAPLLLLLQWGP